MLASELEIGESISNQYDHVTMKATRVDETTILAQYIKNSSSTVVLEMEGSVSGDEQSLNSYDPHFWNITVNDKPVCGAEISELIHGKAISIQASAETQQLNFGIK